MRVTERYTVAPGLLQRRTVRFRLKSFCAVQEPFVDQSRDHFRTPVLMDSETGAGAIELPGDANGCVALERLNQGSERVGGMVVRSAQVRKVLKRSRGCRRTRRRC